MFDTLDQALDVVEGYEGRYFLGKVTENVDPLNLDRIKASVVGLYDPDQGDTPWIGPLKNSPFGLGDSWGVYGSPAIGSDVLILLQGGDSYYPLYTHCQKTAPDSEVFPSGASYGFKDPYGNVFAVTETNITFTSASGVTIDIDAEGNLSIDTSGNVTATVAGDVDVTAQGNATLTAPLTTVNGDVDINGNLTLQGDYSSSGSMQNNGTNVGSSHVHAGVRAGGDSTSTPH